MLDEKLETLLAAAEWKNFSRAAEQLSLTQPAVSRHISLLEDECHAKLFLRNKRELKLTQEGEIAVKYAKRLKALHQKMLTEIADAKHHAAHLRVGITHTSESNTFTEVLAKYGTEHHAISISILTNTIKNLYDMLDHFEIDIAIVEEKPLSANFNYLMLNTDQLLCIVGPTHPLAKQPMITIPDLKREQLILRSATSATRQLFEASLLSIHETISDFNVMLEVDNISTIKDLIRKNLGISVLPKSACMDELQKGKLIALPIENLSMMREMNMVYHKEYSHIDVLKEIVTLYQQSVTNQKQV